MATKRPFPVDPVLTGISIAYRNRAQDMIADQVLPRIDVGSERFKYYEFPLAEGFSFPDTHVGRTGQVNTVTFSVEEKDSSTKDYGLDVPIPISDINEAKKQRDAKRSNFDPEKHATESLTNLIELDREVRVAKMIQDPNNYSPERRIALSGTSCLNDHQNSDPIEVLKDLIDRPLIYRPNILNMGRVVWSGISTHPHLVNAIHGTRKGIITREELAKLLEIDKILVGESMVNTARKGQEAKLERVWGNSVQALYIDPMARNNDGRITFGYTATNGNRVAGSIPDPDIGLDGGIRVRAGERVREVICARDVGAILINAVQV